MENKARGSTLTHFSRDLKDISSRDSARRGALAAGQAVNRDRAEVERGEAGMPQFPSFGVSTCGASPIARSGHRRHPERATLVEALRPFVGSLPTELLLPVQQRAEQNGAYEKTIGGHRSKGPA